MARSILVVEDNANVQAYVKELLLDDGFTVQTVSDGAAALTSAAKFLPDLVVLDLGLPNLNGQVVCQELKKKWPDLPIIILTAKEGSVNVVAGFNIGADDYITKPFVGSELVARIKARLKPSTQPVKTLKVADLELNPKTVQVFRGKKMIKLTPQEFKLLSYLMSNAGQVLSRDLILSKVWAYSPDVESRVVDIYIGYLRHKGIPVETVRGFGYTIKN